VAYRRIEGFVQRATELLGTQPDGALPGGRGDLPDDFTAAMDDDLNTARALACLHEVLREGNTALARGDEPALRAALTGVRAMLGTLGLDPLDPSWSAGSGAAGDGDLSAVVDALVALALEQRAAARDRRDWAAADAIRDQLKQAGVVVEDTPHGPRWTTTARATE
jgi:cysteinyl-tRNA synthetase